MTSGFRRYPEGVSAKRGRRPSVASHPSVRDDVVLETNEIQGNILAGFNKPFQSLLCLRIDDPRIFRWRLAELAPRIATATEVLAFNRLYKAIEQRQTSSKGSGRANPTQAVRATWVNIAFSYAGLLKLTDGTDLDLTRSDDFQDEAFREGLAKRSPLLGDPATGPGSLGEWVVGGDGSEADALIIIASDDRGDLGEEVVWWRNELERCATILFPKLPRPIGVPRMLFREDGGVEVGAKLKDGKEHFGYRDGISQPGLRGTLSADHSDILTPRQNPDHGGQGLPGQDLLWPGEFIFGYPTQIADGKVTDRGPCSSAGRDWTINGSFLVFRRLTQDVHAFHRFLERESQELNVAADWLGARLVGRWQSGAPVSRTSASDLPALGEDDCANNNFEFQAATSIISPRGVRDGVQCTDTFTPAPADPDGLLCPLAAHIRKVYPRDDYTTVTGPPVSAQNSNARERLSEPDTQTHRLLRRGIPFGKASSSTFTQPQSDDAERGLYFLAYQTSIVDQFEFVLRRWSSDPNIKEMGAGYDPIIGHNGSSDDRKRFFSLLLINGEQRRLELPTEWVTSTGGGYFFSPSLSGIRTISRAKEVQRR